MLHSAPQCKISFHSRSIIIIIIDEQYHLVNDMTQVKRKCWTNKMNSGHQSWKIKIDFIVWSSSRNWQTRSQTQTWDFKFKYSIRHCTFSFSLFFILCFQVALQLFPLNLHLGTHARTFSRASAESFSICERSYTCLRHYIYTEHFDVYFYLRRVNEVWICMKIEQCAVGYIPDQPRKHK